MANETFPAIAPYQAVEVKDTTDETRTDLQALLQRQEEQIAALTEAVRLLGSCWDSISRLNIAREIMSAEIATNIDAHQHIILSTETAMGKIGLATEVDRNRLVVYDLTHGSEIMAFNAS